MKKLTEFLVLLLWCSFACFAAKVVLDLIRTPAPPQSAQRYFVAYDYTASGGIAGNGFCTATIIPPVEFKDLITVMSNIIPSIELQQNQKVEKIIIRSFSRID